MAVYGVPGTRIIYIVFLFFEGTGIWPGLFSVSVSVWDELEILGQIASFERNLRRAAPMLVALPYPFCT